MIRYDVLAQEAMRSVVKKVLNEVVRAGLPGEHHFYITFNTEMPGVRISSKLKERYPEEMTIVVQHQFWDLEVNAQSFEISLAFSGIPEKLVVPYSAIKSFVDPSVQFALQFDIVDEHLSELTEDDEEDSGKRKSASLIFADEIMTAEKQAEDNLEEVLEKNSETQQDDESGETGTADVVSLDAFRKKAE